MGVPKVVNSIFLYTLPPTSHHVAVVNYSRLIGTKVHSDMESVRSLVRAPVVTIVSSAAQSASGEDASFVTLHSLFSSRCICQLMLNFNFEACLFRPAAKHHGQLGHPVCREINSCIYVAMLAVLRAGHLPLGTSVVLASCCPSSSKPGSCLYSRHSKHTCRCMLTCKSAYERSTTAHRLQVSILAIYKSYTQSPSASLQSIPRADRDHIIC